MDTNASKAGLRFSKKGIHINPNAVNNISRERKSAARRKRGELHLMRRVGVRAQLI